MKKTKWMNFWGGMDLIFTLVVLILLAVVIMFYNQVSYFFQPLFIILSNIIAPAILALLLYYLFDPLINFLEKNKVKRIYAVILLYLVIISLVVIGIGSILPSLANQLTDFVDDFPEFFADANHSLKNWTNNLPFSTSIDGFIDQGEEFVASIPENTQKYLTEGFSGLSKVISGLTNVVVTLVIAPIMLFFLLKDDEKIVRSILAVTPPKWREDLIAISSQINNQVGAYVKGQLIVATGLAIMAFIGFSLIGLEYNVILAIITGITSIIPYVGPIIAFSFAFVIAITTSWWMVIKLLIVWAIVQFMEGNVIQPSVMGKQLAIHPLTIIIVLLVAGDLLGFVGLILGVPLYAIIRVFVRFAFEQFKLRYNYYYGEQTGNYEINKIKEQ